MPAVRDFKSPKYEHYKDDGGPVYWSLQHGWYLQSPIKVASIDSRADKFLVHHANFASWRNWAASVHYFEMYWSGAGSRFNSSSLDKLILAFAGAFKLEQFRWPDGSYTCPWLNSSAKIDGLNIDPLTFKLHHHSCSKHGSASMRLIWPCSRLVCLIFHLDFATNCATCSGCKKLWTPSQTLRITERACPMQFYLLCHILAFFSGLPIARSVLSGDNVFLQGLDISLWW